MLTLDGGQIAGVHAFIVAEHVRQPGYDGRFTAADFARSACLPRCPGRAEARDRLSPAR
jgi:hypothetical protein